MPYTSIESKLPAMYRLSLALIGLILTLNPLIGQFNTIEDVLQQVVENNKTLIAFEASMQKDKLSYKTLNNLPDPQFLAYYLPFGEHNTNDYTEFEISQRVEFPTVYSARKDWILKQEERLKTEYQKLKQEVLLDAKKLVLEIIYFQKRKDLLENRLDQARKVYDQEQKLFDKGEVGILNINKAKIVWINQQFELEELQNESTIILRKLKRLNGGEEIAFQRDVYPDTLQLLGLETLWASKMQRDPAIQLSKMKTDIAQQAVNVEKQKLWPDLTAGYNYQGVAGNNYSGFYGGLSIPLWSGRNKVKMAESNVNLQEMRAKELIHQIKYKYASKYQRYKLLLNKYNEYKMAMQGLQSERLLRRSYELGEMSFLEYFYETEFYRNTENRMLEMENELQQLKAELLKHQL
jgi:outer membrane protein TolC